RGDPEAPLFPDEDPEVPQINEPGGPSIDGDGPAGRRPADRSRRRLEERDEVPPVAVAQIHGHEIPEPAHRPASERIAFGHNRRCTPGWCGTRAMTYACRPMTSSTPRAVTP